MIISTHRMLGIEPKQAEYKETALPAVVLLRTPALQLLLALSPEAMASAQMALNKVYY